MKTVKKQILFSDLDGTLLDHNSYSYEKSLEGISLLKAKLIPLVLVSSKTFPELKIIHNELELDSPFVFENGGGIAYPQKKGSYFTEITGHGTGRLLKEIDILKKQQGLALKTMQEMEIDEVINLTGLSRSGAELAMERQTSVPFVLQGDSILTNQEIESINQKIKSMGLFLTKGGRFYHLSSNEANKGNGVRKIINYYKKEYNVREVHSAAIGDSENDVPMLRAVDTPVLVRKADGSVIDVDLKVIKTSGIGPDGFTEFVKSFY